MGKGGGTTQSTVTQTNLPDYVRPYFEDLLDRADSESQRPYESYGGQRIADVTQQTQDARAGIAGLTQNPLYGDASSGLQDASGRAGAIGGMQSADFRTDVNSFMSPYMQNVVDVQKQQAVLDFNRSQSGRDAQAVQAGAFGGSRGAVVDALAQEQLSRQLGDIQAMGSQQAFENASSEFNNQRNSTLDYGRLGLSAAGVQGEMSRAMADVAGAQQRDDISRLGVQDQAGRAARADEQAYLDLGYQDFINQRDYGRDALGFYSSILRGIPVTPSTETQRIVQSNPLQQILGGGLAALGTYNSFF